MGNSYIVLGNGFSIDLVQKMKKIEGCLSCGKCKSKCPYELDTPELLKKNYEDYQTFL